VRVGSFERLESLEGNRVVVYNARRRDGYSVGDAGADYRVVGQRLEDDFGFVPALAFDHVNGCGIWIAFSGDTRLPFTP